LRTESAQVIPRLQAAVRRTERRTQKARSHEGRKWCRWKFSVGHEGSHATRCGDLRNRPSGGGCPGQQLAALPNGSLVAGDNLGRLTLVRSLIEYNRATPANQARTICLIWRLIYVLARIGERPTNLTHATSRASSVTATHGCGFARIYLNSSVRDFKNSDIRQYLEKYLRGSNRYAAIDRRSMAWGAIGSEFGGRRSLARPITAARRRRSGVTCCSAPGAGVRRQAQGLWRAMPCRS